LGRKNFPGFGVLVDQLQEVEEQRDEDYAEGAEQFNEYV